ncbi:fibronectin type III domain-containing protein [Mesoterricola sediminis]|uniref:Fibronectin type-III domain-containing protein n=1 Tax=Mesoterricola sediminis TaxID=2927980 RepID=A0AA48KBC8_9BACT|nr:hypothetical protein [Mesoterricola sediminis]BDU75979.1 hypothetical protein METESE_09370 [Mesoterricola sediminis]
MAQHPLRPLNCLALLALAILPGCSGGGGQPQVPLEPPTHLTASWSTTFADHAHLTWTAPAQPVDGYNAEFRIDSGGYTRLNTEGLYNPAWTYGHWPIPLSTLPELTPLSFRMSSTRGSGTSGYSNEASLIAPLRAPARPVTTEVIGGYRVTWINNSLVADSLTLERGVTPNGYAPDAVWTQIPGVAFGALDYTDFAAPEGAGICYRVTYARGAASTSSTSLVFTSGLNGPVNLVATPGADSVHLTWANRSTAAASVVVARASTLGADPTFLPIATLPPTGTSFDDVQVPTGYYTYRVEARAAGAFAGAPSPAVKVAIRPAAVPGLTVVPSILPAMPSGSLGALAPQGTWFLGIPPGLSSTCRVFHPVDGTWVTQAFASATRLASPGLASDAQGRPHLVLARPVAQGSSQSVLVHAWFDGGAWQEEEITRTSLPTGFAPPAFVLPAGSQHPSVLFLTSARDLIYMSRGEDGTWQSETLDPFLPVGFVCDRFTLILDGAGAPAVLAGDYPGPQLLRRTGADAWVAEALPSGLAEYGGRGSLVATADGDLHLFLAMETTFLSRTYNLAWSRRSGGAWSSPATLVALRDASPTPSIQAKASPDGTRVIVACPTPLGNTLLAFAQGAWAQVVLGPALEPPPLLGFMSDGRLRVLQKAGYEYANGWSDYVQYTEP